MITNGNVPHFPVMLSEMIQCLSPQKNEIYVDGTFGAGGYSSKIIDTSENCTIYAFDRDPEAKNWYQNLSTPYKSNIRFIQSNFSQMVDELAKLDINQVDGIILDLGVSSMQLDQADRGFSFMKDAKLDMRMSQQGNDASELINNCSEEELANIIYKYGDEHKSRRIAKKIVEERKKNPITSTLQLASIVRSIVGYSKNAKIDPATKTFQAIRIWVNDELHELEAALEGAEKLLKPGGRLVVISFHSLEDSIVKKFLHKRAGKLPNVNRHLPMQSALTSEISFELITKSALKPSKEEILINYRSRSAKLRAAKKLELMK